MKKTPKILEPRWLLVLCFFIVGVFLGGLASYIWFSLNIPVILKTHPLQAYQYINPLLAVDTVTDKDFSQNKVLEIEIQNLIANQKRNGKLENASAYFRDIEPGHWVGVNENGTFSPGKLLKIPLMIVYFKLSETNPDILDNSITFAGPTHQNEELNLVKTLEAGKSYTVRDLIRSMIVDHSDDAANVLFDNVDKTQLDEIFSDLGIQFKEDKDTEDFVQLKPYSLFFRVLYNATYLNRENSEKALELIHEGDSSSGIVSGLPKNIRTSTRFGGRKFTEDGVTKYEVYDCGIMYYPNYPYLLCAVASGEKIDNLKAFLKDLGLAVYKNFSYQYK